MRATPNNVLIHVLTTELLPIGGPRKFRRGGGRGGGTVNIFSHQRISKRAVRTSLEKQLDPAGPIASRGGRYQYF